MTDISPAPSDLIATDPAITEPADGARQRVALVVFAEIDGVDNRAEAGWVVKRALWERLAGVPEQSEEFPREVVKIVGRRNSSHGSTEVPIGIHAVTGLSEAGLRSMLMVDPSPLAYQRDDRASEDATDTEVTEIHEAQVQ